MNGNPRDPGASSAHEGGAATTRRREEGTVLLFVLVLCMVFGFLISYCMQQSAIQTRDAWIRLSSVKALYDAYAHLETAQKVIELSDYNSNGKNKEIQDALARADKKIDGTDAVVAELTGPAGTWYSLTVSMPYADNYERVVQQVLREIDYFSSYNLFVSEDPAGISGAPVGAIHSNDQVQFYFPNGSYSSSVTAVNGFDYKVGATAANTQLLGDYNDHVDSIALDTTSNDRFNLTYIRDHAEPGFSFPSNEDLKIRFYTSGDTQYVTIEQWTQPRVDTVTQDVIVGYNAVNPHTENVTWSEWNFTGYVTETRTGEVPVYETQTVSVTQQVPIYESQARTREVTRLVWVTGSSGSGGTTVGGDSSELGHYEYQTVTQTYTEQVLVGYNTVTSQVQQQVQVGTQTQTWTEQVPQYEEIVHNDTVQVYDYEPIIETQQVQVRVYPSLIQSRNLVAPSNGIIYAAGNIKALSGTVVGRMTVATNQSIKVDNLVQYVDQEGDTAYLNGTQPWLPYESNPNYAGNATLGLIASQDILYSRNVPTRMEINASMLAMHGRVGIEGVVLDNDGDVINYNKFFNSFGDPVSGSFSKESMRRLGGITTAKRPVETVVDNGVIASGFTTGQAVFDEGLLEGPPPFFIARPVPRFFSTQIIK